jgi:hypothetical protein
MKKEVIKMYLILTLLLTFVIATIVIINQRAKAASAVAFGCRGAYGYAYNASSTHDAKQRALDECKKYCNSCRIILESGSAGWGAVARNERTGRVGCSAGYESRYGAEQRALRECGSGCIIKAVWNDTKGSGY